MVEQKLPKLNRLRFLAEEVAPTIIAAWPPDTRFAQRSFELLRRAHVEARYSKSYVVTAQELDWMKERVAALGSLISDLCRPRLGLE